MAKKRKKRKYKKKQKYFAKEGAWMSYKRIHKPNHPRADMAGFVAEHILIMERLLDRPLSDGEIVHHKDFHKANNQDNNLQNMTRKEHQQIPLMQARFLSENGLMDDFFKWWLNFKSSPQTLLQRAEMELVRIENQKERMKLKLEKQNVASDS